MCGTPKEQKMIDEAIARFPYTFGLRAFPGDVFRISASASYFTGPGECGGTLMLYTQRLRNEPHKGHGGDDWVDFAKGTEAELRAQMTLEVSR